MTLFGVPRSSSEFLGGATRVLVAAALIALVFGSPAFAKNGAFKSTRHGDPVKGPQRKADQPAGSCVQCHDGHKSHRNGAGGRDAGLFAQGVEACTTCHAVADDAGSFPGLSGWTLSTHARERMERPGSDVRRAVGNPCVACHDPHGVRDSRGVIPALLALRERELCLECHDGTRGADIRSELQKGWWHGMDARGEHDPAEARGVVVLTARVQDRHVSCSDCHNPHAAAADRGVTDGGEASERLAGVSRVQIINGAAGSQPSYRWLTAQDPSPAYEYEICLKCHSSATKQRPQDEDIARTTNPANPSFHPLQGEGRNRRINPEAFVSGVSEESRIRCTDCHGSDSQRVRGPHGSSHEHLLKSPVSQAGSGFAVTRSELCFNCHAWQVYGSAESDTAVLAASRFNAPSDAGHAFHVAQQRISCMTCHEPHGSLRYPALIAARKRPGITSYSQTAAGGTCTPTCHSTRTYKANYAR